MSRYIHQLKSWPAFTWDQDEINELLIELRHLQGRLIGGMASIGFKLSEEAVLQSITQDVVQSSAIEGEVLDQSLVRSSVAKRLGMEIGALGRADKQVDGVVEMVLDATQNFQKPLTKERLFSWHKSLFPNGRSDFSKVHAGMWREGPVYVVSRQRGEEVIHLEGPPAELVDHEMKLFLDWINHEKSLDLVLKAALAHLWFVTIHPFDDGNGRIGRAIADLLLARSEKSPRRFYSLSAQIQAERKGYYTILEATQKGNLDVTAWIKWFFGSLERAITEALTILDSKIHKSKFWEQLAEVPLNERQQKMINRLLDDFEGKLTTSKWAKMTHCSQDTAYRDILDLVNRGILVKNAESGRSTSYSLAKL